MNNGNFKLQTKQTNPTVLLTLAPKKEILICKANKVCTGPICGKLLYKFLMKETVEGEARHVGSRL